jgi:hypothetical protein
VVVEQVEPFSLSFPLFTLHQNQAIKQGTS